MKFGIRMGDTCDHDGSKNSLDVGTRPPQLETSGGLSTWVPNGPRNDKKHGVLTRSQRFKKWWQMRTGEEVGWQIDLIRAQTGPGMG